MACGSRDNRTEPSSLDASRQPRSRPLDARRIAAGRGEMHVQIGRARIGEQFLNRALDLRAFDEFPASYHPTGIEATYRQRSVAQLVCARVDRVECLLAFAYVDCAAHPVRRGDRMVLVINQDQFIACFGVGEADAAGVARLVGNSPDRAAFLERPVRHSKQRSEWLGRQTLDTKVHVRYSSVSHAICATLEPLSTRFVISGNDAAPRRG